MNTRSMAKTMLSIEKRPATFWYFLETGPTLLETNISRIIFQRKTIFPATFEVDMWPLPGGHLSKHSMNFHRNTLGEFAPSQYKLRTKILEFCRSSKPPVARSRNRGSYQTQKHFGNFGVPKRWGMCLMSRSNPKQTLQNKILLGLKRSNTWLSILNLTPKQCTTFHGKNPCTSLLDSQVFPTYILVDLASLNTFIFLTIKFHQHSSASVFSIS